MPSLLRANDAVRRASFENAISANGQVVVFDSTASNLVLGDTNERLDVFVQSLDHN